MKIKKQHYQLAAVIATVVFILIFSGVRFIVGAPLDISNIFAHFLFACIIAFVATLLVVLGYRKAFTVFMLGLTLGFFEMYRAFFNKMSGWGDLIGLLNLMILTALGLFVGLFVQAGFSMYERNKLKKQKRDMP